MKNKTSLNAISSLSNVPEYNPVAVKKIMARYELNERAFALLMNVTPITVRLWIAGAAKPCALAKRLIQIFDTCPDVIEHITTSKGNSIC